MNFKLGIVSSYDVLCGNATYSQALIDGLPEGIEPVKIDVPVKLQKYRDVAVEKQLLKLVADCDAVNIQVELGLYGPTPDSSVALLKKIIKSAKRASLTMHRVEEPSHNLIRLIYNILNRRQSFMALVHWIVFSKTRSLIKYAIEKNASFIVHTHRERARILDINSNAHIIVHPIIWPNDYCQKNGEQTKLLYEKLFMGNKYPVIGLFGFMSDYKNFLQVARVVASEKKYKVLLAGGTHPQNIDYGKRISPKSKERGAFKRELAAISDLAMRTSAKDEPLFASVHSPDDAQLVHLIKCVDIVVIPYSEVGQSASGIASLAIQFGKRVLFSDTHMAQELLKFLNRKPNTFDTQSDLSLACALKHASEDEVNSVYFREHDFNSNITAYLNSLNIRLDTK